MMQYAISTWIVEAEPADEAIRLLADAGFRKAELSGGVSPLLQAWEEDPVGVRRKLDMVGIDVPSVHCPRAGRLLDVADGAEREASASANVEYFEWMKECGIPEIVIHPTSSAGMSTDEERSAVRARSVESLKTLAESAGQLGIRLAVENLGTADRPGSSMADLLDMIDGLGDHVGLCLDIGHSNMAGFDILDELRRATDAGKLFSLHIHDVNEDGKDHFMPGEGRLLLDTFVAALDRARFSGGRILEISPPQADVAARLREAAAVRDAWEAR